MSDSRAAVIEIIERRRKPAEDSMAASVVIPNEVRINGQRISMPADGPIIVHEMSSDDVVKVTLTVFARRIFVGHEDIDESVTDAVAAATAGLVEAERAAADAQARSVAAMAAARDQLAAAHRRLAVAAEVSA